jgi:hypothetical protein
MINIFKKQYWVSPTNEWWGGIKEEYKDWWMGRVEVFDNNEVFDIDEWRFQFPPEKSMDFQKFMDRWEGAVSINWIQLQYIKWIVKHKFYIRPYDKH